MHTYLLYTLYYTTSTSPNLNPVSGHGFKRSDPKLLTTPADVKEVMLMTGAQMSRFALNSHEIIR